ncbi:MAG: S8 family serine peptidase, partial [Bacteroidota bacterium]|nr:S8 family serine peptidase [Bacteroidota bacterium]
NKLEIIEYAEKEPIYKTTFVPNDSYHNGTDKWYHTLVNSEQAWDISLGSESIKIAIIDNGAPANHLDLNVFKQRDVSDNDDDATPPQTYNQSSSWSHGTHCAGLATAEINNSTGIASLGGNVELIVVKATGDNQNPSSIYNSYTGVQWACENGANVVSMSYGSENSSNAMQDLIYAYPEVVFIAAAGNDSSSTQNYPAAYQNVIGVGSVDSNDLRSSFSNYNVGFPWVDIAAPGGYSYGGLLSTVYTESLNGYARFGGTSMATPFAAGLVGLMLSVNPSLTPIQIQNCLVNSGVDINQNIGPRIDAYQALLCVQPENDNPIPAFTASPQVTFENQSVIFSNNSVNGTNWVWTFEGGNPSTYEGQNPPEIFYSSVGDFDVSLTVTNSSGDETLTKENYITVYFEPSGEWILQNTTFGNQSTGINYISIADENVVWATAFDGTGSGQNMQQFTKTNDGGDSWQSYNIDIGDLNLGVSMIHAYDDQTAWLVAYPRGANQIGGIFKTIDGGENWVRQDSALYNTSSSFANVVYFWDENTGFAQGDPINGEFELYVTENGGENWVQVPGSNIPNPLGGEYGYTRQIEINGNNVWYTTNKGRIYKSSDKGNNWVVYQSPIADFGSAEVNGNISFSDSQNGILVDNSANVYKSVDGGASWDQLTPNGPVYTSGLCYIDGTNTIFTTGNGSSFSLDGGYSWTPIDTATHLFVDFYNEELGWSGAWTQVTGASSTGGVWKWEDFSLDFNQPDNDLNLRYYPNPTNDFINFVYDGDLTIKVYNILGQEIINTNDKLIDLRNYNDGVFIFKIWDFINQKSKSITIIKK